MLFQKLKLLFLSRTWENKHATLVTMFLGTYRSPVLGTIGISSLKCAGIVPTLSASAEIRLFPTKWLFLQRGIENLVFRGNRPIKNGDEEL